MGSKPSKASTDAELYAKYGVLIPPCFAIDGSSSSSSYAMHHFHALIHSAFTSIANMNFKSIRSTCNNKDDDFMQPRLLIKTSPYLNVNCDSALELSMKGPTLYHHNTTSQLAGAFISSHLQNSLEAGIGGNFSNSTRFADKYDYDYNEDDSFIGGYVKYGNSALFTKVLISGNVMYTAGLRYARSIWNDKARIGLGSDWSLSRQDDCNNLRSLVLSCISSSTQVPLFMRSWLALQATDDSLVCAMNAHIPNCIKLYHRDQSLKIPPVSYSYILSMDLNKINSTSNDIDEDSINSRSNQPTNIVHSSSPSQPLKLNFMCNRTDPTSSGYLSVSVSQQIPFDRLVSNPIETRCPKIRNILEWSVEMKRDLAHLKEENLSKSKNNTSSLNAEVCWQVNRGLACKMRVDDDGFQSAFILRRWAHPMITCSLSSGVKKDGKHYQGVGLIIETSPTNNSNGQKYPDQPMQTLEMTPITKKALDLGNGSSIQISRRRSCKNLVY